VYSAIDVMLRLQGQEPTRNNIRSYQAEALGRFGGTTLYH
jgi:hypothetical protein